MNCLSSVLSFAVSAPQDFKISRPWGIHDREQQMLDRHEFMARLARAGEGIVQAKFEFLT
jgi:hypothetical protein